MTLQLSGHYALAVLLLIKRYRPRVPRTLATRRHTSFASGASTRQDLLAVAAVRSYVHHRTMWEKHGAAIITGATAIIAATLAAWFTSASTRDVVREESHRVAQVRDENARGAARVLIGEFLVVGEELGDWVSAGVLVRFGPDFPVAIRQEDLSLIAARVTPRRWNAISRGLAAVQALRRYVLDRTRKPNRFTGKLISRHIVDIVAHDLAAIRRASLALSEVAGAGDEVPGITIKPDVVFREIQRKSRKWGIPIADD